jgi:molybdopterin-containing oxidoreductase family molybdopterin binding subunit
MTKLKELLRKGISRRAFNAGALAAAATLAGCGGGGDDENLVFYAPGTGTEKETETITAVTCRPNCFSSCYINAHLRNNRIVKLSRRDLPNSDYNRICLRGLSQMQRIYAKERILYPLIRDASSPRGNPVWKRATWPEAIEYIVGRFEGILNDPTLGNKAIAHLTGSANYAAIQKGGITKLLNNLLGATTIAPQLDMCQAIGFSRALGISVVYPFMQASEPSDFRNAKTIIAWGSNAAEAQIQSWHFIADAVENNGATLISVDVTLSSTAARANKFVHLYPATDTLLALSMLNEIIVKHSDPTAGTNCWVDYDFMKKNTIAPFIINPSTKGYLRYSELDSGSQTTINTNTGRTSSVPEALIYYDGTRLLSTIPHPEDYMIGKPVITASATAEFYNIPASEALSIGGTSYNNLKTAFDLLKERVTPYTPASTQARTGVDPAVVEEFTKIYCTNGPASIIGGFAPDHYNNGHHVYHTLTTLAAITGQIGKPGASIGMYIPFLYSNGTASSDLPSGTIERYYPYTLPITIPSVIMPTVFNVEEATSPTPEGNGGPNELFMGTPAKLRALWVSYANPLNTFVDPASTIKMLTAREGNDYKVRLVVVPDMFITDTAEYADVVLPLAHWFEQEDVTVSGNHPHCSYQPKAVNPPGECKTDMEIAAMIAEKMGYGKYFHATFDEYADGVISPAAYRSAHKSTTGEDPLPEEVPTWQKLKQAGTIRIFPGSPSKPYVYPMHRMASSSGCDDMIFGTQSAYISGNTKRIEFYAEAIFANSNYGQAAYGAFFTDPIDTGIDFSKERLPDWEEPAESVPGNSTYPFQLISERPRWRVHSMWHSVPWIREFDPYPTIKINTADAASKEIESGDVVAVFNSRGHCFARAVVSVGIRKGVINLPKGWHASQFREIFKDYVEGSGFPDAGSSQSLTTRAVHPVSVSQSFFDNIANIRRIGR